MDPLRGETGAGSRLSGWIGLRRATPASGDPARACPRYADLWCRRGFCPHGRVWFGWSTAVNVALHIERLVSTLLAPAEGLW